MAHFSFGKHDDTDPKATLRHPTLAKRRQFAQIRRYGVALLLAFAVFFALQSIADSQRTQTVVVTAHAIKRGMVLRASDVREQSVPHDPAFDSALPSAEAATGLVAQTDMVAGSMVLKAMTGKVPALPTGLTISEVRISHSSTATVIGDTVSLVSPIGCQVTSDGGNGNSDGAGDGQDDQPDVPPDGPTPSPPPQGQNSGGPQPEAGGLCVLAKRALVMSRAHEDSTGETTVMEFALTPQEAAATARVQEQTAVMVVTAEGDGSDGADDKTGTDSDTAADAADADGSNDSDRKSKGKADAKKNGKGETAGDTDAEKRQAS